MRYLVPECEVVRQDYIRTGKSKRFKRKSCYINMLLRNALIPVITLLGFTFTNLFSGAVITEIMFAFRMGKLQHQAVMQRIIQC